MTTLFRMTVAGSVLALSGLALTPIFAQGGPPPGGPAVHMGAGRAGGPGFGRGPGGAMGMIGDLGFALRQLELTDTQREQVRGVMQSHDTEFHELGQRMRTARQALDAAISADTLDEATIRAASADWAAVEADASVLRARVRQEVFNLLTSEQQAKAKELKAAQQQRIKERGDRIRERGAELRARRDRQPRQG
jgi:Spy/CpxP family protein refolding chaperone